ncbi:hypothetical protein CLAIMM_06153 [Cladophialophora immunda]|nr:hypothetical protein CLAIMM_06153 [Cladophialophora immunda]
MNAAIANFNSGQGLGGLTQYAWIGSNLVFVASAVVTSFAVMLGDPFNHFDSHPTWMFTNFLSFAVATFNISITGSISSRFRNVADSVPEPGYEDKRILNMKTAFYLSIVIGAAFAAATTFLAIIWGRAASESIAFVVPCTFGVLAVSVPTNSSIIC